MAFKFKVWIVVIFLILVLLITVQTNQPNGEVLTDADPIELSQCRAINKGKWCTCRKLQNFVKTKFGKELGLFIPAVSVIVCIGYGNCQLYEYARNTVTCGRVLLIDKRIITFNYSPQYDQVKRVI